MIRTIIKATGRYLPPRKVTNHELSQLMDTSDEWIRQRTGIEQRYWAPENGGVGASDMALEASRQALARARWRPDELDLIIFATLSPDLFFPGSGCLLQTKLGLKNTPALDLRQQCTGFLYGLATAHAYIQAKMAKKILLVGAEVQSTGLDLSTRGRDVSVIFGDGAGAVCLQACPDASGAGVLTCRLHADGSLAQSLMVEAPSSKRHPRISADMLSAGRHYPVMDGRNIFKLAVRLLPEVARAVCSDAGLRVDQVDLFIPHQANLRINQSFAKSMNLSEEKIVNNVQRYGNTTAASIPLALDEAIEQGRVKPGNTVMFFGLGSGLTWGAVLYRFQETDQLCQ